MKNTGIIVHTDGGARGNPGPAASAYVVEEEGKIIEQASKYLGVATNNVAEYRAVIYALRWLSDNGKNLDGDITFLLDSELVVKQINGVYRVKDENLKRLFLEIVTEIKKVSKKIIFKHVPRSENKLADFLVNQELDSQK